MLCPLPSCEARLDAFCSDGNRVAELGRRWQALCNTRVALPLIDTTEVFSIESVNSKQMKKWLEQQGATFQPGKGSHLKVFLNGRQSTLPMHGTAELGKGLEAAIKRQLGLK